MLTGLKRKNLKVLFISTLLFLCLAGTLAYFYSFSDAAVDASGVVMKTGTPEDTVTTYHELLAKNRFARAADLQTEKSRKIIKAKDIETQYRQAKLTSARLAKVFKSGTVKNLAVVGHVRMVAFPGNDYDSAIVGITVLTNKNDANKWEIISSLDEVGQENYLVFLEMVNKLDREMGKEDLTKDGFTEQQISMVKSQVEGMSDFHQQQLKEYKGYLETLGQKKKDK